MKIRNGFVSNSSSSSFVIWTKEVPQETMKKLLDKLKEMKNDEEIGDSWGDSGKSFYMKGYFLEIETYYLDDNWWNFFKSLQIAKEFMYDID